MDYGLPGQAGEHVLHHVLVVCLLEHGCATTQVLHNLDMTALAIQKKLKYATLTIVKVVSYLKFNLKEKRIKQSLSP